MNIGFLNKKFSFFLKKKKFMKINNIIYFLFTKFFLTEVKYFK